MFKKMDGKIQNFTIELETKYKQHNLNTIPNINKYMGSMVD